jgi:hypothetical protein
MIALRALFLWILSLLGGCSMGPAAVHYEGATLDATRVTTMQWADFGIYNVSNFYWLQEANERFIDPFMFHCHGGSLPGPDPRTGELRPGTWVTGPTSPRTSQNMGEVLRTFRNLIPIHRPIVVAACNPGLHTLDIPGVYYVYGDLWHIPDAIVKQGGRWANNHEVNSTPPRTRDEGVGSIWEFVTGPSTAATGITYERPRLPLSKGK